MKGLIPYKKRTANPAAVQPSVSAYLHFITAADSLESYESVLSAAKRLGREALEKQNNYEIRRNLEAISLFSVERMRPYITC